MNSSLARAVRWIVIAAGAICYPFIAHFSTTPEAIATMPWLGVTTSLTPALAILFLLTWQSPKKPVLLLLWAIIGLVLWQFWGTLERNFSWAYFIQHAGTNLMLAAMFGATLAQGRQPLCTRFAEAVHRGLTPEMERYSRQVTVAWTLFFVAMSLISAGLFLFAPLEVWSVFANFLNFPLVLLMFAVEYRVRLYTIPNLEKHSILDGMRAFWKTQPGRPGSSSPLH